MVDFLIFFTLYWKHVPYNSCTSLIWVLYFIFCILRLTSWKCVPYNSCTSLVWVLYFISIFLDWHPGSMYHIIHAQVQYEFCISFLYFYIDVLNLNQPFNWTAQIWKPFKMKLIRRLQSWTHERGGGVAEWMTNYLKSRPFGLPIKPFHDPINCNRSMHVLAAEDLFWSSEQQTPPKEGLQFSWHTPPTSWTNGLSVYN